MVEIEEIKDGEEDNTKKTSSKPVALPPGKKYRKPKKELPKIGDLLAQGDPESAGKPKSWFDVLWYPIFVAGMFFISWQMFKNAPLDYNRKGRPVFKMNDHPAAVKEQVYSNQQQQQSLQHTEQKLDEDDDAKKQTGGVPENIEQMEELVDGAMKGDEL